jgi:2-amino-4-hydroxy-6-hydroxymethyldihydropteridine diphosphokinase
VRRAFFSLGSNLGDRAAHLRDGVAVVSGTDLARVSHVYRTEPISDIPQDDFYNLVLEVETEASARDLFARARDAESRANRVRGARDGPRTLDVDVLLVGDDVSDDPVLTIPHPRMWERRFVLAPLVELAPELVDAGVLARALGTVERIGTLQSLRSTSA